MEHLIKQLLAKKEQLQNVRPEQINTYYKNNRQYMEEGKKAFYYYMKDVLESKNILLKDVYSFAGVTESYGSKILTMEKHTKNRDLIIRFCIAGHFLLGETNRALKLYGMSPLYAKDKRDACLIVAINNRKYDLFEIDNLLEEYGLPQLSAEE